MNAIPKKLTDLEETNVTTGRTPEQVLEQQKRAADKLPAVKTTTAVAVQDSHQKYLDLIAPATIVGRLIKFDKSGKFITADDDAPIADTTDFTALVDQTLVGWIRFNGEGSPPDRIAGLLYDGFELPSRDTLGDDDEGMWQLGLNGHPQDPWLHQICLVVQRGDNGELFTFTTQSITGRRAVGNLLRAYDRMRKTHRDMNPVIRFRTGGFNHRDERVGWVSTPRFDVVGRVKKDSSDKPDGSVGADMDDEIPF
jgi:hypothetical protein